jgi:hypothetical protein
MRAAVLVLIVTFDVTWRIPAIKRVRPGLREAQTR